MADEEEVPVGPKPTKALIVLTSTASFPDGSPTGYYLSEVVHPYDVFTKNGWVVEFASVSGEATCDPASVEAADADCLAFWEDAEKKALLTTPIKLADIVVEEAPSNYECIYFAGGFGTMWDFPACAEAHTLIKAFAAANKVVAGVCHGVIVFTGIVNDDETKFLEGKSYTGFSNEEEEAMGKLEVVSEPSGPGSCQDVMLKSGGLYKEGLKFESNIVIDGLLFTGQNPASAAPLATAIVYHFNPILGEFEPPRLALLKEREVLIGEIKAAAASFESELAELKKSEAAGTDVAEKIEMLQLKAVAGRDYRVGRLTDIDRKLERNALMRAAAVAAAEAAAKAAAEEE